LAFLAAAALVLTFVVVVASAFMRHVQGVGCADWPACYGRVASEAQAAATPIGIHIARLLHRLAASSALLAIVIVTILSRRRTELAHARALAIGALAAALALAALGIATPGATLPAVPLGNLAGGFLMIALLAALVGSLSDGRPAIENPVSSRLRALALALLAAVFVQTLTGGLIGTQFALPACPTLDGCSAGGDLVSALNPFRLPRVADGRVVPPAGASDLHVLHRGLGVVIAVAMFGFAYLLRGTRARRSTLLFAALGVAAPLTGAFAILHMPAPVVTVVHNALAASSVAGFAYFVAATRGICPRRRE
jgi:cytochrome c oxidase assembly protein subunit 15